MSLYPIKEIANVYVDALVADDKGDLVFLSVWGLDTAIQEFIAKISLPNESALKHFFVEENEWNVKYRIADVNSLKKLTGRAANKESCFNNLVQLWLYDRLATEIDYVNHRCLLLKQHNETEEHFFPRLWQTVQAVYPVPLLPEWHDLLGEFRRLGWITHYVGKGVDAYRLDFSNNEVEKKISEWINLGKLTLPKEASSLSLVH